MFLNENLLYVPWSEKFLRTNSDIFDTIHHVNDLQLAKFLGCTCPANTTTKLNVEPCLTFNETKYNNCDSNGLTCGYEWNVNNNITDTTYYFISKYKQDCMDGLRLGFNVTYTESIDPAPVINCSLLPGTDNGEYESFFFFNFKFFNF